MSAETAPSSFPSSTRLRIGHLIASDFAGGPEKQILTLSQRLRDRGWTVLIGSFRENRAEVEVLERARSLGFATFAVDTTNPFDPSAIVQVRRQLRLHRLDVLVTHGYKGNIIGRLATLGTDTRPLATVRGFTAATWRVVLYEKLDRLFLRTFPLVLCVSDGTRRVLESHGLSGSKYRVLHNAVACDLQPEPLDLRAEYSLPADSRVILAAGRLSPEKGHRFLVEAMDQIRQQDARVHCLMFGNGGLRSSLDDQIRRLGLQDRVVLAGFRKDVLRCLAGADLVVNPSLTEGLPNVVLEAMSQSTAVAATDVGGVGELIEDGRSGWLVEAGRPDQLAKAILSATEDDDLRARFAHEARRTAVERFSFEHQAERFQEYCNELRQT